MADADERNVLWGRVIAVAFLIAAGGIVVTTYSYGVKKFATASDAPEQIADAPPRRPGAPTREEVKKLEDSLRRKLGTNERGLPRVTLVEFDDWPDRLSVVYASTSHPQPTRDHPQPTQDPPPGRANLHPLRDVLYHAHAAGLNWSWILLSGTAPTRGYFGPPAETTVVRAVFSRKVLDGLDWSTVTDESLPALADQFTADPALGEVPGVAPPPRHTDAPATTQPAAEPEPHDAGVIHLTPQLPKKSR